MSFVLNLQVHSNPITAKFIDCDVMQIETKKGLYRMLSARFYSWLQETPPPNQSFLFFCFAFGAKTSGLCLTKPHFHLPIFLSFF